MFDHELEELQPILSDVELETLTAAEFAAWDEDPSAHQLIPDDLDSWLPGPFLAAVLGSIDPAMVNGHDAVRLMRAHARQIAHDQAAYYRSVGEVARTVPTGEDGPAERTTEWFEDTNLEGRAALTLTRRAADMELGNAYDLLVRFPRLWESLSAGDIAMRKVLAILRGVRHLDQSYAREVIEAILPEAPGLITGQIRTRIRRLCLEVEPEEAARRTETAVEERKFIIEPTPDGTADIYAYGAPLDRAAAIGRRINGYARSLKNAGDSRPMDQIRVDVALDLLEGDNVDANPGSRGGVVVHASLETLAELSDTPGELAGYGPVHADMARQVAAAQSDGQWSFVVRDEAGNLVHTGTTRRRPTAAQERDIVALCPTFVFPGCPAPANECDIDHITPHSEGGPTTVGNNAPVCEPDHNGRHRAGWIYRRLPDGSHEWTSRLGHTYITRPERPP